MLDIFSKIGQTFSSAANSSTEPTALDKLAILSLLEELTGSLNAVDAIYSNPEIVKLLNAPGDNPSDPASQALAKVYGTFVAQLSSSAASLEHRAKLSVVALALKVVSQDMTDIQNNFDGLFGHSDPSLAVSDIRISTASTIGYIENAFGFLRWATYVANMALSAHGDHQAIPPYQFTTAYALTPLAAALCNSVLKSGGRAVFMERMRQLKSSGKDVLLSVNGATLDQYAGVSSYDTTTLTHLGGFLPNLGMMFGKYSIDRQRVQLEDMKHIQNWLRNKLSLLQLTMNRADPNSPEYRRAKALSDNYLKDLAATDKKLAQLNG